LLRSSEIVAEHIAGIDVPLEQSTVCAVDDAATLIGLLSNSV